MTQFDLPARSPINDRVLFEEFHGRIPVRLLGGMLQQGVQQGFWGGYFYAQLVQDVVALNVGKGTLPEPFQVIRAGSSVGSRK